MSSILRHNALGLIRGRAIATDLLQYSGLPYASIQSRFARSELLNRPLAPSGAVYDATTPGPESVQPETATEVDAAGNQFPHLGFKEAPQSENCLYLNVTAPRIRGEGLLPVVVFLHGGAFFVGSGSRPYYEPINLLARAIQRDRPLIFVSIHYRLAALGFLHHPDVPALPPNNALHDQIRAFEWVKNNIEGFGGDPERVTALGQSAGAMSLSLHSISDNPTPMFKQMICLSGSPVTMPTKTPEQYKQTFTDLAKKLGVKGAESKIPDDLGKEFMDASVGSMRDLGYVGAPCTSTELLPYAEASMATTRSKPSSAVPWIERALYSSATYDGGVSYNLINSSKRDNARTFRQLVAEKMSKQGAEELLALYGIQEGQEDMAALERICHFESDIGFFWASHAQVTGSSAKKSYLQLFDLKNPFDDGGELDKDKYSTHTWDIVSLLGKYDDQLSEAKLSVVQDWRDRILDFVHEQDEPCPAWETAHQVLSVGDEGVRVQSLDDVLGRDNGRRRELEQIAERERGSKGLDYLWEGVCRQWLDG